MPKRKHYKIVQAQNLIELEDLVNTWIDKRQEWHVIGGIVGVQTQYGLYYAQAMKRQYRNKSRSGPSKMEAKIAMLAREKEEDGLKLDSD